MQRLLLLGVVLSVCAGVAVAQGEGAGPGIHTSGKAVLTVPPNALFVTVLVSVEAESPEQAKAELAQAREALRRSLEALGIERLRIESDLPRLGGSGWRGHGGYEPTGGIGGVYRGGGQPGRGGYQTGAEDAGNVQRRSLQILVGVTGVDDVQRLGDYADQVRDVVLQHDTSRVQGSSFCVLGEAQLAGEREALQKAVERAIANAEAIAQAAGVTIKGYERISGTPTSYYGAKGPSSEATSPPWQEGVGYWPQGTLVCTCDVALTAVF